MIQQIAADVVFAVAPAVVETCFPPVVVVAVAYSAAVVADWADLLSKRQTKSGAVLCVYQKYLSNE